MARARKKRRTRSAPAASVLVEDVTLEPRATRTVLERFYLLLPILCFLISTMILGYVSPGMQYDEAIFEAGAVRLVAHSKRLPPSRQATVEIGGVHFPLMVLPYAGAMKDYLLLLPFALFGTAAYVGRSVAAVLGALGIAGFTFFLRRFLSLGWAIAGGVALAVHPGTIHWILYDNGNLAFWMFSVGGVLVALWWYIERRTSRSAFLFGFALGLAVWGRANFLWPVIAALIATAVVRRSLLREMIRDLPAISWGGIIGALPLLIYEIKSGFGTLAFMSASQDPRPFGVLLPVRLKVLLDSALFDSDRRGIWNGPPVPLWQSWFVATLIVAGALLCLFLRGNSREVLVRRISALTLVITLGITLSSRLTISSHHIVPYTPLAILIVIAAGRAAVNRWPFVRHALWGVGGVFLTLAILWNVRSGFGLRKTGGVRYWSDAINVVAERATKHEEVKALDWGFSANLFVVSRGEIDAHELFWSATDFGPTSTRSWAEEVERGGIFLLHPPETATDRFSAATRGFLSAVADRPVQKMVIPEKSGAVYAHLYGVGESGTGTSETERVFWAEPNPVMVCDGTLAGTTRLFWKTAAPAVELRLQSPSGTLFATGTGSGTALTGKWVSDGLNFFLTEPRAGDQEPATLGIVTVRVSDRGCKE